MTPKKNTHHPCRPYPKVRFSGDVESAWRPATAPPSGSRSFENRKPSNSSGFGKISPSVWTAADGTAISVPAGTVTPLENVNGRNARRTSDTGNRNSASVTEVRLVEANGQTPGPSTRRDSRMKLSILCILSIPALVQPSSATAVSTSRRRGSIYSGLERRW